MNGRRAIFGFDNQYNAGRPTSMMRDVKSEVTSVTKGPTVRLVEQELTFSVDFTAAGHEFSFRHGSD